MGRDGGRLRHVSEWELDRLSEAQEERYNSLGVVTQPDEASSWQWKRKSKGETYGTAQHAVSLLPSLLNVILQRRRIQWLQKFKTAKQFPGNGHDSAPVIEFAAVLNESVQNSSLRCQMGLIILTLGAEKTVTRIRSW